MANQERHYQKQLEEAFQEKRRLLNEVHTEKEMVRKERQDSQKREAEIQRLSADSKGLKSIIQQEQERIKKVERDARAESLEALRRSQEDKEHQRKIHEKRLKD